MKRVESQPISEQAAQWLCVVNEGGAPEQAALMEWLRQSPKHVEEFLLATSTWQQLQSMGGAALPISVDEIAGEIRGLVDRNVVAINPAKLSSTPAPRRSTPPYLWRIKWTAAATLVLIATAFLWRMGAERQIYSTTIGEQRTVRLEDGSVLYLNTASRARIDYTEKMRKIELLEGEALFVVAQERDRPFSVSAGEVLVQAVGTQFNVLRQPDDTRVSVIEGRVQVSQQGSNNLLDAGEEVSVRGREIVKQPQPDIARTIAWRERRLVFRADRLEEVIAQINRYSPNRFRIEGDHAREVRLTATFDADSPQSLAEFLRKYSDLAVEREGEGFVVRSSPNEARGEAVPAK